MGSHRVLEGVAKPKPSTGHGAPRCLSDSVLVINHRTDWTNPGCKACRDEGLGTKIHTLVAYKQWRLELSPEGVVIQQNARHLRSQPGTRMNSRADPYQPPAATLEPEIARGYRLYSPMQIGVATFLGYPIAGCWLLAENFRRLGRPDRARLSWIGGIAAMLALLVLAVFLPADTPNMMIPTVSALTMHQLATQFQHAGFQSFVASGGYRHSNWRVAGISVACLVVVTPLIFLLLRMVPTSTLQ